MNLKHNDKTASILELLKIEKKYYDDVLGLLDEQLQAIEQEDAQRLDAVIAKKESIILTTGANRTRLEKFMTETSPEDLPRIANKTNAMKMQIESVLTQIIAMENNCQTELQARKFLTQDKILDLKQRKSLLKNA